MNFDCDALVIGAGPAGTACAILLAQAGWRVIIVEQHLYPRRKVCGECIAAGNLELLDRLGIGADFRRVAGPELRRIGWMGASSASTADMPPCPAGAYRYGRAVGRDWLDAKLLQRAASLGVVALQPARARAVRGELGGHVCTVDGLPGGLRTLRAPVVVDAHGSWERGPRSSTGERAGAPRIPRKPSDLLAFKANFRNSALAPGFLPVLAVPGGYGGMVVANGGLTTLACCLRRDAVSACRAMLPHASAGAAVEALLRRSCSGVHEALKDAQRDGNWLSVGPLRPGIRVGLLDGVFRVGNAAGESHALIGEGISMALQSSALLAGMLTGRPAAAIRGRLGIELQRCYATAWRRAFASRLRLAALYAHVAMRPRLAEPVRGLLHRWPILLRGAAQLAGKTASGAPGPRPHHTEMA
ncbi:MAG TPA: NAD(P)/FAD-dependent oxidoreductase [Steroidobacteraceae bacterium]|nr:NAD(P)/FAD-dependent oxidoreductase [Steroidobacteraceae bacterium]